MLCCAYPQNFKPTPPVSYCRDKGLNHADDTLHFIRAVLGAKTRQDVPHHSVIKIPGSWPVRSAALRARFTIVPILNSHRQSVIKNSSLQPGRSAALCTIAIVAPQNSHRRSCLKGRGERARSGPPFFVKKTSVCQKSPRLLPRESGGRREAHLGRGTNPCVVEGEEQDVSRAARL